MSRFVIALVSEWLFWTAIGLLFLFLFGEKFMSTLQRHMSLGVKLAAIIGAVIIFILALFNTLY